MLTSPVSASPASRLDSLVLDMPRPRWQHEILELLCEWGYDDHAIDCVLQHLSIHGSVECNPTLDREHKPIVEALVPMAPESAWAEHDGSRWTISGDRPDATCRCGECAEARVVVSA
jgi:hypothetical protein